jgi:hypothetical protein
VQPLGRARDGFRLEHGSEGLETLEVHA